MADKRRVFFVGTVEEHAKTLRTLAEATARHSQNWDNYEKICLEFLQQALAPGKTLATHRETGADHE